MLEVTRTAYDSVMYFDTKEYKDIGPFGQMPLLRDPPNLGGGMGTGGWLPQSSSIVRHIARVNSLDAGPDDPVLQVCHCRQLVYACSVSLTLRWSGPYAQASRIDISAGTNRFCL